MRRKRDQKLQKLFKIYQKFPCLWNPEDSNYKNTSVRRCGWTLLKTHYDKNCTHLKSITRMKDEMTKYARMFHDEERRRKDLTEEGMGHTPDFVYYKDLLFLGGTKRQSVVKQNQKETNQTTPTSDEDGHWEDCLERMKRLPPKQQNDIFKSIIELEKTHREVRKSLCGLMVQQKQAAAEASAVDIGGASQQSTSNRHDPVHSIVVSKKTPVKPKIRGATKRSKSLDPKTKSQLDEQLMIMIAKGYHPLRLIEEPEFKKFISMLCPSYNLPTRKKLSDGLLPELHFKLTERVKNRMTDAPAISLSADAWTSSHNESYVAVTAHYIDSEAGEMRSNLLGCIEYDKRHNSLNLCNLFKDEISKWNIQNKIVAVVSDDDPKVRAAIQLAEWRPVSCFAHRLSLTVQTSIKQISVIVKKVKNIVEFFKRNPQDLYKIQKQMNVPLLKLKEGETGWKSVCDMLERVLNVKDALTEALKLVCHSLSLSSEDWTVIEKVVPVLKVFLEITVEISTERYVSLSIVIMYVTLLKRRISQCLSDAKAAKDTSAAYSFMETMHEQISTQFDHIETNELYAEATILDPRFKASGFHDHSNFKKGLAALKLKIVNTRSLPRSSTAKVPRVGSSGGSPALDRTPGTSSASTTKSPSIWSYFDRPTPDNTANGIDELNKYINEPIIDRSEDPLLWWYAKKPTYPLLYRYMLKRLNIVAVAAPCERIFTKAGLILADRRAKLSPKKYPNCSS